ncbi:sugar transferase [Lysinibacillus fusiformis]
MHVPTTKNLTFYGQYGKRIFDIIGALLLLFMTIPLMLAVFLILLISTGRPIFFKQIRTGTSIITALLFGSYAQCVYRQFQSICQLYVPMVFQTTIFLK